MGLAPGGRMQQDIYDDPYGLDAWDQRHASRCFVTIANSVQWMALTGERAPTEPPTARQYAAAGLPWFEYFGGDLRAMAGSDKLRAIASVAEIGGGERRSAAGGKRFDGRRSHDFDTAVGLKPSAGDIRRRDLNAVDAAEPTRSSCSRPRGRQWTGGANRRLVDDSFGTD